MTWLFDTCAVSAYIAPDSKKRPDELVSLWTAAEAEGICVSSATVYELRRGMRKLGLRGEGRRQSVVLEKILRTASVITLDDWMGATWRAAVDLWADGQALRPSQVMGEMDLLIAATALATDRTLVTMDVGLRDALTRLGRGDRVRWIAPPKNGRPST